MKLLKEDREAMENCVLQIYKEEFSNEEKYIREKENNVGYKLSKVLDQLERDILPNFIYLLSAYDPGGNNRYLIEISNASKSLEKALQLAGYNDALPAPHHF